MPESTPSNTTPTSPAITLTTSKDFFRAAKEHANQAVVLTMNAVASAHEPGETKNRALALARTLCGLLFISTYFYSAVFAALLFSTYPPIGNQISSMMDDMLNGLFAGLPTWSRYIQPILVVSVALIAPNFPVLSLLGQLMAAKLAMELAYRNYVKEAKIEVLIAHDKAVNQ